eukprot:11020387-Lingulodinium_polyedra.AAC.1
MSGVLTETLRDLKSSCNISELAPIAEADPAIDAVRRMLFCVQQPTSTTRPSASSMKTDGKQSTS